MAWIESHEEIGDHKKTSWLAQHLQCDIPTAVGYVHLLWHYTLKVAWRDGNLSEFLPQMIERACWWSGDSGKLIKALQGCGYLDGMKVHDWKEYAKHIIYQRIYNKKRRKESTPFPQSHYRKSTAVNTAATVPYRTVPNHIKEIKKKVAFIKPTPQEVTEYAKSIGFRLDGEKFCAHYEASGWKRGKTPIVNWRACVVTWKKGADVSAMILTPKVKTADPKPEECVGAEQFKELTAILGNGKRMT